jgi:hypothetical protein
MLEFLKNLFRPEVKRAIPRDLYEAISWLSRDSDRQELSKFKDCPEDEYSLHHTVGRGIRNSWKLWEPGTVLYEWGHFLHNGALYMRIPSSSFSENPVNAVSSSMGFNWFPRDCYVTPIQIEEITYYETGS